MYACIPEIERGFFEGVCAPRIVQASRYEGAYSVLALQPYVNSNPYGTVPRFTARAEECSSTLLRAAELLAEALTNYECGACEVFYVI